MRRKALIASAVGLALAGGGYSLWKEHQAYSLAVTQDAAARGWGSRGLQYPAHWPLELAKTLADSVCNPRDVERLLRPFTEVSFFLAPTAGMPSDSIVYQVFSFRLASRTNKVAFLYDSTGLVQIYGTDFIPTDYSTLRRSDVEARVKPRCK